MSGHTPGPWYVEGRVVLCPSSCGIVECCGICQCHHGSEPAIAEANARLIAAAPELLEALRVLLDEAENFSVSGVYFNEPCMGHKGPDLARAAIAKATGSQP